LKKGLLGTLAVVALVVVVIGGSLAGTYNDLVGRDQDVKGKWAQVDNQLKRRADLIPNLVETVKGFASQEKSIMTAIADARAKLAGATGPAEAAAADAQLSGALSRLLVVVENYPNLKSDANFRALMYELSGTENRIAVARKDYNESVQSFNTKVRSFPTNLIAGMFGFGPAEFFAVGEADKQVPNVDFNSPPPVTPATPPAQP
jgi:LemA protein